jgi:hypothetical protein
MAPKKNRIEFVGFALHFLRPPIRLYCIVYTEKKKLALLSHILSYKPLPNITLPSSFHCSLQLYMQSYLSTYL